MSMESKKKYENMNELKKESVVIGQKFNVYKETGEKLAEDKKRNDELRKEIEESDLPREQKEEMLAKLDKHKKELEDDYEKSVEKPLQDTIKEAQEHKERHEDFAKEGGRIKSYFDKYTGVSGVSDRSIKEGAAAQEKAVNEHRAEQEKMDKVIEHNKELQDQLKQGIHS